MERIDLDQLLTGAVALRERLADLSLPLATERAADARRTAEEVRRQLDEYVVPRLRDLEAPVLAVVGGSTGAGKSTLVNSLVGADVTRAGVLRPTTRSPVLIHHPSAVRWFDDDRVLGSLARVRGGDQPAEGANQLQLVESEAVPEQLALLDAPDIDSVVDTNRELAHHLLDAADLWVFVTTAARYADAVPWDLLRTASRRGVGIGLVLNRVPPGAGDEVGTHLASMLAAEGFDRAPLFAIDEQPLGETGRIPARAIAPLREWLDRLAGDREQRAALVLQSLRGAVEDVAERSEAVAAVVLDQERIADDLADIADRAFALARDRLRDDVRDGTVMRGEVLARWQDLVGTGELLRELQSRIGRLRDRIAASVTGRPRNVERFQGAVESGIEALVRERIAEANEQVVLRWRATDAGAALLDDLHDGTVDDLRRPSPDLGERIARLVRDWQGGLLDLLRQEGAGKRTTAKVLSYGLNGAALVLMVAVFAQTGGLTGAEVAIAGGSTAVGSTLLEALLGDQAVRRLADRARADLDRRTGELLAAEAGRFTTLVDRFRPDADAAAELRSRAGDLRRGLRP